jgi:hypothetical protein
VPPCKCAGHGSTCCLSANPEWLSTMVSRQCPHTHPPTCCTCTASGSCIEATLVMCTKSAGSAATRKRPQLEKRRDRTAAMVAAGRGHDRSREQCNQTLIPGCWCYGFELLTVNHPGATAILHQPSCIASLQPPQQATQPGAHLSAQLSPISPAHLPGERGAAGCCARPRPVCWCPGCLHTHPQHQVSHSCHALVSVVHQIGGSAAVTCVIMTI